MIGGVAVIAAQPWLFPSLGPSIFLHVHKPNLESARLYNTVMGHLIGVAAGEVGVLLTGASQAPSVLSSQTMPES
nr:hypothetical protein [Halomonas lionensis]